MLTKNLPSSQTQSPKAQPNGHINSHGKQAQTRTNNLLTNGSINHKHWSERVLESIISKGPNPDNSQQPDKPGIVTIIPGLEIKGGAEHGQFNYFNNVNHNKILYHAGKVYNEDLILEVNSQTVAGLTTYDLHTIILNSEDPLTIKHVKENYGINRDLRHYLSKKYEDDSIDKNLQDLTRDNLYLRTLPHTTRKPRIGEIDGKGYKFISEEEFHRREKNEEFLESGTFKGNWYATPRPPLHPPSETDGEQPNINDKSTTSGQIAVLNGRSKLSSGSSQQSSNKIPDQSTTQRTVDTTRELPPGWELSRTNSGNVYYIDHNTQQTSWQHPALDGHITSSELKSPSYRNKTSSTNSGVISGYNSGQNSRSGSRSASGLGLNLSPKTRIKNHDITKKNINETDKLPEGWEKIVDQSLGTYYINHITQKTTYDHPNQHQNDQISSNMNNQDPDLTLEGYTFEITVNKGRSFGLTIIGGDEPDTLIQVRNVVPNIPVISEKVLAGDVIVAVNDTYVIGWSHGQLVELFNSIPTNSLTTIKLCRGYPLPDDEIDHDQNDLHQNDNMASSGPPSGLSNSQLPGSTTQISHMPAQITTLNITKGPNGFGFHFFKDMQSNQVQILTLTDQGRSNGLMENDVLIKIDTASLDRLDQNGILELLNRYPISSTVTAVVERRPILVGSSNFIEPLVTTMGMESMNLPNVQTHFPDKYVVLKRTSQGFGFRIKQGTKRTTIGEIIPGGAADVEGTLKKGDEVITLDGESILGLSGSELVKAMTIAADNGTVSLGIKKPRKKQSSNGSMGNQNSSSALPQPHANLYQGIVPESSALSPLDHNTDIITVKLTKYQNEGFGFVIMTNQLHAVKSYIHTIGNIIENSPSFRCGKLKLRDRIVSVNGKNLTELDHNEVVNLIRLAKESVFLGVIPYGFEGIIDKFKALVIYSAITSISKPFSQMTSDNKSLTNSTNSYSDHKSNFQSYSNPIHIPIHHTFEVTIHQNQTKKSFGFGLRGGKEYGMRLYILRVAPNGPADCTDPKIFVGDRLVRINNSSCEEPDLMEHKVAIDLIRRGGSVLRLTLVRGDGSVPKMTVMDGC